MASNSLALNLTIRARESEKGDSDCEIPPMGNEKNDYTLDKSRGVS